VLNSVINPSIGAGELIHRIDIQQPETDAAATTFGRSITPNVWTTVRTTFAAIEPSTGAELAQPMQLVSEVSHCVKVRWTPVHIASGFRVVYNARFFTVKYVINPRERNRVLLLYCLEVNN
jgi:SPP1 family predicted phage head-tail adaptor